MKVTSKYPQVFHVLPHEKAYLADEAIERIRAQDINTSRNTFGSIGC